MDHHVIEQCGRLLAHKKLTIAFAESATAGQVSACFSLCEQAGDFLKGGLNCYDAGLKERLLKVPKALIEEFTPESQEVTFSLTRGLTSLIPADIHIGITGLTRPGGSETTEKPVGTMFFCALFGETKLFEDRIVFTGTPQEILKKATVHIAKQLYISLQHISF